MSMHTYHPEARAMRHVYRAMLAADTIRAIEEDL